MIIGRIKLYLAAACAFVVALFAAYLRGRRDEAGAEHERDLNEYVETRKRMDAVEHNDVSSERLRDWLRERGKQ